MKKAMKKVAVIGVNKDIARNELKAHGFVIDRLRPDFVVSFGGDGSALVAEQLYPGIPRLTIKHSSVCEKCIVGEDHMLSEVFGKIKKKRYRIIEEMKLEAIVDGNNHKRLIGLNEINIANAVPIKAIRFDVVVNKKSVGIRNLIGDGVIIATPYGSSAYYNMITGRHFSKGIGIAFNNTQQLDTRKKMTYKHAKTDTEIKVRINRGPALLCADNNTTMISLKEGDVVTIRKAKGKARLIKLTGEENKLVL